LQGGQIVYLPIVSQCILEIDISTCQQR